MGPTFDLALSLNSEAPPLTVEHETAILGVLDGESRRNLSELRAVLLKQQQWRAREGIS